MSAYPVKILFLSALFLITSVFFVYFYAKDSPGAVYVYINDAKIEVELADSVQKRAEGLSGRENLGRNQGMLFVFERPDYYSFWMKDMNFALDVIWIDENKKIVDITKNILPESYPKKFQPHEPAKYVLEVNASFADAHNIKISDTADF